MISPHTAPGTKVVLRWKPGKHVAHLTALVVGGVYTVENVVLDKMGEPCINLIGFHEINPKCGTRFCYSVKAFDYAELPRSITSALTSQPLVTECEHEVAL